MSTPGPLHPVVSAVPPALPVGRQGSTTAALVLTTTGILLGGGALLLVLGYLALALGPFAVLVCAILALVPLVGLLLSIRWIDRWEPEPRAALWFALLWGAGIAVAGALIVDLIIQVILSIGGQAPSDFLSAVVQAPVVEEASKGFGILVLFWAARRHFDGPVDGLVYGATIGAGFAFTENILYFGQELVTTGGGGLAAVFVVRGIFSPFAHVMFTACIGVILGAAAHRAGAGSAVGFYALGLLPAVALHALWNGAFFVVDDVALYYLVVQVPLFLVAIAFTILLRRHEARVTRVRLAEYAARGWFTQAEVEMLATPRGRRAARRWARTLRGDGRTLMRCFLQDATRLAYARQRILIGREDIGSHRSERELLDAVTADRQAVLAAR